MVWRSGNRYVSLKPDSGEAVGEFGFTDYIEFDKPSYREMYVSHSSDKSRKVYLRVNWINLGKGLDSRFRDLLPRVIYSIRRPHSQDSELHSV